MSPNMYTSIALGSQVLVESNCHAHNSLGDSMDIFWLNSLKELGDIEVKVLIARPVR